MNLAAHYENPLSLGGLALCSVTCLWWAGPLNHIHSKSLICLIWILKMMLLWPVYCHNIAPFNQWWVTHHWQQPQYQVSSSHVPEVITKQCCVCVCVCVCVIWWYTIHHMHVALAFDFPRVVLILNISWLLAALLEVTPAKLQIKQEVQLLTVIY